MKRNVKINDLDTLEKEIYRLKLESKMTEAKLDKNLNYLKDNYPHLLFNYVISKKSNSSGNGFKHAFFRNEKMNNVISSVADHVAEYATESIKEKIDKLFGKK